MANPFTAIYRKALQSLVLVPAYAAAGPGSGDSKKKGNGKNDDSTGISSESHVSTTISQELYAGYHGADWLNNTSPLQNVDQYASHVGMFCSMTGPFAGMIDKGFATSDVVPQVSSDDDEATGPRHDVKLNLRLIVGADLVLPLNSSVESSLHNSTLVVKPGAPVKLCAPKTLLRKCQDDAREVKKLLRFERQCYDASGNLPSGYSFDDLENHIWKQSWSIACYTKHKKSMKKKKTLVHDDVDDGDGDDEGALVICTNDEEEDLLDVPSDFVPPSLPDKDGKWHPDGWPVYVAYLCSITRFTDDYVHLFKGDARSLDNSKAKSRSAERKQKSEGKRKHQDPTNSSSDAMSLVGDRQMTANLLLRRSAEESNHLDNNGMHLQSMIDTLMTQRAQAFKMADILTDVRDKVGREDCPEWNEYMALGARLFEKQNEWTNAMDIKKQFIDTDAKGKAADEILSTFIPKKRKSSSRSPIPFSIRESMSASPASQMSSNTMFSPVHSLQINEDENDTVVE